MTTNPKTTPLSLSRRKIMLLIKVTQNLRLPTPKLASHKIKRGGNTSLVSSREARLLGGNLKPNRRYQALSSRRHNLVPLLQLQQKNTNRAKRMLLFPKKIFMKKWLKKKFLMN